MVIVSTAICRTRLGKSAAIEFTDLGEFTRRV